MRLCLLVLVLTGCSLDASDKNRCDQTADCLDGFVCESSTKTCVPETECEPATTCGSAQCGALDDGCGGVLQCGGCAAPDVCGATNQCEPPPEHCTNGQVDPGETDVDCGAECAGCGYGKTCATTGDCAKGSCDAATCRFGTWTVIADMPTPRQNLAAVLGPDGLLYTIGGSRGGSASGAVEAYDPSTDSWTARATLPVPRSGLAAVVGSDGLIYVIGGEYFSVSDEGNSMLVHIYNPATNTWSAGTNLPIGRYKPAATLTTDGRIFVSGGFAQRTWETLATATSYQSASWAAVADSMTSVRSGHVTVTGNDGKIYAISGYNGSTETPSVEYYKPGVAGWHTLSPIPTARKEHAAARGSDGRIYVFGGSAWLSKSIPLSRAAEVFDPALGSWSVVTRPSRGRYGHAAVATPDGRIFLFGGRRAMSSDETVNQSEQSAVVDVFVPDP